MDAIHAISQLKRLSVFPLGLIASPVEVERRGELEEAHIVLERELAEVLVVNDAGHGPRLLGPVVGRQAVLAGDDLKRYLFVTNRLYKFLKRVLTICKGYISSFNDSYYT